MWPVLTSSPQQISPPDVPLITKHPLNDTQAPFVIVFIFISCLLVAALSSSYLEGHPVLPRPPSLLYTSLPRPCPLLPCSCPQLSFLIPPSPVTSFPVLPSPSFILTSYHPHQSSPQPSPALPRPAVASHIRPTQGKERERKREGPDRRLSSLPQLSNLFEYLSL